MFECKAHRHHAFDKGLGISWLMDEGSFQGPRIIEMIAQARVIAIERRLVDLEFHMSRWSIGTHTFMASWGEFIHL